MSTPDQVLFIDFMEVTAHDGDYHIYDDDNAAGVLEADEDVDVQVRLYINICDVRMA